MHGRKNSQQSKEHFLKMTVDELKQQCVNLKIATQGQKIDLINRLIHYYETGNNMRFVGGHLKLAQQLIQDQRPQEALQWLEGMRSNSTCQQKRLEKIKAFTLMGNHDEAQKERLLGFAETLWPSFYTEILKHVHPDSLQNFQSEAIEQAFGFPQPHTALHFLLSLGQWEIVSRFVSAKLDELHASEYSTLRPAANLVKNHNPLLAILIYRKMIADIFETGKSQDYHYVAKDLIMCNILAPEVSSWDGIQTQEEYLSEIERQHHRKKNLWSQYQTLLKKQSERKSGK